MVQMNLSAKQKYRHRSREQTYGRQGGAVGWMDLESVIQSEVSQKEKNKYCILTHIYGI